MLIRVCAVDGCRLEGQTVLHGYYYVSCDLKKLKRWTDDGRSRRSLKSELDALRSDLSSVGLEYSPPPAGGVGGGGAEDGRGQETSAWNGGCSERGDVAFGSLKTAWAKASGADVAVAASRMSVETSARRALEQEDTSGGEGSGGDEELLQIGRLQKSRIETRLGAHGDPGKEFEDLISSDHPPDALRNTILALVLLLGEKTSSFTPSWFEVRRLVPSRPWSAMRQVQLHKDLGSVGQEKIKAAARSLALVLPAEAWAVSQSCGMLPFLFPLISSLCQRQHPRLLHRHQTSAQTGFPVGVIDCDGVVGLTIVAASAGLIHEWINVVIDVRRLAADLQ